MSVSRLVTRQAVLADLELIVPLFDAYRQFYRQASDLEGARRFLLARFENGQSTIFLAFDGSAAVGFAQLYPSFSSTAMARIFILNDLYVAPEARRQKAATALLEACAEFGRKMHALRLMLSTELTNATAQATYESLGWKRDNVFCSYQLMLSV